MSNRKPSRSNLEFWILFLGLALIMLWESDALYIGSNDLRPLLLVLAGASEGVFLIFYGANWRIRNKLVKAMIVSVDGSDLDLETITAQKPTYILVDSVDREILDCISHVGGDLVRVDEIVIEENLLPNREELKTRLRKLIVLGLIRKPHDYDEVYLTSRGRDALNAPAPLFASNIPTQFWGRVQEYKIALWQGKWSEAMRSAFLLLEEVLKDRIKPVMILNETKWNEIREKNYQGKELEEFTLGESIGAARQLELLTEGTLEYWLASELNRIRKPFSHSKDGNSGTPTGNDAANVDLLMDIFLQILYGRV